MGGDAFLDVDVNVDWSSDDEPDNGNPELGSLATLPQLGGEAMTSSEQVEDSPKLNGGDVRVVEYFRKMGFDETMVAEAIEKNGEENTELILETLLNCSVAQSSASSSRSKLMVDFMGMGFSEEMVAKVLEEHGEEDINLITETLLTYSALETPQVEQPQIDPNSCSSGYEEDLLDDFSSLHDSESEDLQLGLDDSSLSSLRRMGYEEAEASVAIKRCGPDASISELTDFICAARMARADDSFFAVEESKPKLSNGCSPNERKRSVMHDEILKKKKMKWENGDDELIKLPNPMVGFGLPTDEFIVTERRLPKAAMGPPFFYYENVALAPKGVWQTISRFLYDVEPEFVDSKYICAAARKRGYVHNLPIHNRFPLIPLPPTTIHDALPLTRKWWPAWDSRTKLNCLLTCTGSSRVTDRILKQLESCDGDPPLHVRKAILDECRKWNLVWVGRNKAAPLEPDEVEMLLGFPRNHTRGGGLSRSERYKSLGNSFQIDTVAYHLSVLKELFPGGLNLLSLFSGIGGAEVALHRLGIPLKTVVSVEISEGNRAIMRCWWEQTNQKGNLVHIDDVRQLDFHRLEELMDIYGSFDLIVGGSPCNNLAGGNRHYRTGLEGKESSLFYDYIRILDDVKKLVARKRNN
ncbi:hypothetical protein Tsubulata_004712 [Turnera subulata]|uniref:DNA (cytosine-5-)-methyltransferase n=1 Tax=Turnera subulata TaxID=218843 RepID=A0A9Q0FHB6_9ROSI|nr:hypothetical protein Tsubulata_004712 [Turnera subulata]